MSLTENAEIDIEGLNDVYRELCDLLGFENMYKLYTQYKGFQINFPTRLYNKDYVHEVIKKESNGTNARDLARRFGYSERWIKSISAEESKEDSVIKDEGEN